MGKQSMSGYYVTPCGRVYSYSRKKWLVPIKNKSNGYLYVNIAINRKKCFIPIHKLVAQTWIDNPNGYKVVNHIDEDKTNNKVDNLEWCTHSYNITYSRGVAVMDNNTGKMYPSIRQAANDVGCPEQQIWQLLNGVKGKTAKGHTFTKIKKEMVRNYAQF